MEFERSELSSMGWFGNWTPQEERGSFFMFGPCLVVHSICSIQTLHSHWFFLIHRLGSKTPTWEDFRFGEIGNKKSLYNWGGTLISFLTRKELGGHRSQSTSTKLNKLKKNNFLSFFRECKSQGKSLSPTLQTDGYREWQLPRSRNLCWNQCQSRKTWTLIDNLLGALCG